MPRGRRPIGISPRDLDPPLRAAVHEAIDSHAEEPAAELFRRFGLAQRGVRLDTFTRYVARRRRQDATDKRESIAEAREGEPPSWEAIDEMARREALRRLYAGDAKVYELVLLSRSRREADRLELSRVAEQRAAELHEQRIAAWRKAKAEADSTLDRMAIEKGIPGDVAERIKDLYGIVV